MAEMTVQTAINQIMAMDSRVSNNQAYAFLYKTHRWLYQNYILKTEIFQMSVTNGVYEYPLDDSVQRVRTVLFVTGQYSQAILAFGRTTDWDYQEGDWRLRQPTGSPREFGVEENHLFLLGTPNKTSVGVGSNMYPRLEVTAAVKPSFEVTDSLPVDVPEDVYISGALWRWAMINCLEKVPAYKANYEMEISSLNNTMSKASHNYRIKPEPEETFLPTI